MVQTAKDELLVLMEIANQNSERVGECDVGAVRHPWLTCSLGLECPATKYKWQNQLRAVYKREPPNYRWKNKSGIVDRYMYIILCQLAILARELLHSDWWI